MRAAEATTDAAMYVSWRWRMLVPIFAVLLVAAMIGLYTLADVGSGADSTTFAANARLQVARLVLAVSAAVVMIAAFVVTGWTLDRIERLRRVMDALAAGDSHMRTGMTGSDEIGLLGRALDRYADEVQERHDALRGQLRRQRRETEHLTAVLEAVPSGIVVQDLDGGVMMMNDRARELLGSERPIRTANLEALTAAVTDVLGPALAPGLYTLGSVQRVELDERTLSVQAAAVMSLSNQRVGTVLVLRDLTDEIRQEQARNALLDRLVEDVQTPVTELSRTMAEPKPLRAFAREMTRHAVALQKLIVEMRELTAQVEPISLKQTQRPLAVDTILWGVANEWKQVAQAANLKLNVQIERQGLAVLGDERRLRWALGNIVDNAIKYTPPGGGITLETSGDVNGRVYLRVKDTGVGISETDMAHIFTRFYRGSPKTDTGRAIQAPGTGQGLTIAKQIVEAHGGTIRVKSTQFAGTSVYLSLPLTAMPQVELPRLHTQTAPDNDPTVQLDTSTPAQAVS